MTGQQLELAAGEHRVDVVEVLDGTAAVGEGAHEIPAAIDAVTGENALGQRNLFGEAERIAARAASAGTRRQYAAIYRGVRGLAARAAGASAGVRGSRC